jgi:hypothetical protein
MVSFEMGMVWLQTGTIAVAVRTIALQTPPQIPYITLFKGVKYSESAKHPAVLQISALHSGENCHRYQSRDEQHAISWHLAADDRP